MIKRLLLLLSPLFALPLVAQVWTRDPAFNPQLRNDEEVQAASTFAPAADGRVLVVGPFTHAGPQATSMPGVAYLLANGSIDPSFVAESIGTGVVAAAPLVDGRVLAITRDQAGRTWLRRFLTTGARDNAYTPVDAGPYQPSLTPLPNGSVALWNANRIPGAGPFIARLTPTGEVDTGFEVSDSEIPDDVMYVAGTSEGGLVVVTGRFGLAGRVWRLTATGALDSSFTAPTFPGTIRAHAIQGDGRILVGGDGFLLRLKADGTLDPSFALTLPELRRVTRLVPLSAGAIVMEARTGANDETAKPNVYLVDATGAVTAEVNSRLQDHHASKFAVVTSGGVIWVRQGAPVLGPDDTSFPPNVFIRETGSTPTVARAIPTITVDLHRPQLAAFQPDHTVTTLAQPQLIRRSPGLAEGLRFDREGRAVISGPFTHIDGQPRDHLARFNRNGSLDPSFAPALEREKTPELVLAGPAGVLIARTQTLAFDPASQLYRWSDRVRRFDATGRIDPSFEPAIPVGYDTYWHAYADDGRILVSYFTPNAKNEANLKLAWLGQQGAPVAEIPTRFGGLPGIQSVILHGSQPSVPQPQPEVRFANPFRQINVMDGGKLLISGEFQTVNDTPRPYLVRLNADGSIDGSYVPAVTPPQWPQLDAQHRATFWQTRTLDGQPAPVVRRLLANGELDTAFAALQIPGYDGPRREDGAPEIGVPANSLLGPDGYRWTAGYGVTLARYQASEAFLVTQPPASMTRAAGQAATFSVGIGTTRPALYQWYHDGKAIDGANHQVLVLPRVQSSDAGYYAVAVTVAGQRLVSEAGLLTVAGGQSRLVNFSILNRVTPDTGVIGGFTVAADGAARPWLLRGVGPSLSAFGVTETLPDPRVELFQGPVRLEDKTGGAWDVAVRELAARVRAFPIGDNWGLFPEFQSPEVGLVKTLEPGTYTMVLGSASGKSGTALLELYDSEGNASGSLANLSLRTSLKTSGVPPTLGFAVSGAGRIQLLIRAVGPSLSHYGVQTPVPDPRVTLFRHSAPLVTEPLPAHTAAIVQTAERVQAFPLTQGDKEVGMIVDLDSGVYTLQLKSASGAAGDALVEVYVIE